MQSQYDSNELVRILLRDTVRIKNIHLILYIDKLSVLTCHKEE